MNRIVKRHYPVSKLPDDLREGFDADACVKVTVQSGEAETEDDAAGRDPGEDEEWAERDAEIEIFRRKLQERE